MTTEAKFLINVLIEKLAVCVSIDYNLTEEDAMNLIYNSQLYDKIIDLETGLYYQSVAYNYNLLKTEIEYGKIR